MAEKKYCESDIISLMHKYFYASGFIYHSPTQKILLQRTTSSSDTSFDFFSGKGYGTDDPAAVFQKVIQDQLGINVPLELIIPVYDYTPDDLQRKCCILYADIVNVGTPEDFEKTNNAQWFTTKQLSKLKLPKQTEHDITIGQRVIRAETPQT